VTAGSVSPTTAADSAAQTFQLRIRATDMGGPFPGTGTRGERRARLKGAAFYAC